MTKETSLLAKLMKSKYHPHGSLWEALKGYKSSFTWASILEAKRILEEGCMWSIGDGRVVDIKRDRWIPKIPRG